MKTILQTTRLLLRELTEEDEFSIRRLLQDKETMYAYEHAFSDEEVLAWLNNQLRRYREEGCGLWAVILKATGNIIGQCGLTLQPYNGERVLEVGYLLEKEYWHRGYAIEAADACKRYAFDRLGAEIVYSIIRDNNFPSQKVALRNGMHPCGTLIKQYYGLQMPHLVYCISKQEMMQQDLTSPPFRIAVSRPPFLRFKDKISKHAAVLKSDVILYF